jgi:hypothetical protein
MIGGIAATSLSLLITINQGKESVKEVQVPNPSIVVLPFETYLPHNSRGETVPDLDRQLTMPNNSAQKYKNRHIDDLRASHELGVRCIIEVKRSTIRTNGGMFCIFWGFEREGVDHHLHAGLKPVAPAKQHIIRP